MAPVTSEKKKEKPAVLTGSLQHKTQKKEKEISPILMKISLPNFFYDLQAPLILAVLHL